MDVIFPMKSRATDSLEKIPMGFNPTNQTTTIGKFPIGFNPTNFVCKSFESNRPLALVLSFRILLAPCIDFQYFFAPHFGREHDT